MPDAITILVAKKTLSTRQISAMYNDSRINYIMPRETFLFCFGSGDGGRRMSQFLFVGGHLCGASVGIVSVSMVSVGGGALLAERGALSRCPHNNLMTQ
jgi:hypothetical protein